MENGAVLVSGVCAGALILVHGLASGLRFLDVTPRSAWLSAAGGVAVAYVFIHLIPELAEQQREIGGSLERLGLWVEGHVWIVALAGLAVFYGLERLARLHAAREVEGVPKPVFWLHIASYAAYNGLVGYVLGSEDWGKPAEAILFTAAIGTHFLVNDFGLQRGRPRLYRSAGRWIIAAAVLVGWASSVLFHLPRAATAIVLAFLAGGIVLNVLKEELPEERESRYWAFVAGLVAYAALLLWARS